MKTAHTPFCTALLLRSLLTALLMALLTAIRAPSALAGDDHDAVNEPEHPAHEHAVSGHEGHGDSDQGSEHHDDNHHDHERVTVDNDMVERLGIRVDQASAANLIQSVRLLGELVIPPNHSAEVRARFPGLIKSLHAQEGDQVTQGDLLAIVESDASLRDYRVTAPVSGLVQRRSANLGELTGAGALFRIVSDASLWAELKIFPQDRHRIQPGQAVIVRHLGHDHRGIIRSVGPGAGGSPYRLARVSLTNTSSDMQPGDMIEADVTVAARPVAVSVTRGALQTYEGNPVVFVREAQGFSPRPVRTGFVGAERVEILEGLTATDRYVSHNSYLLRADLEKSGAAHEH